MKDDILELCKRLKFGDGDKWYIPQTASILENEMVKIPKNSKTLTDNPWCWEVRNWSLDLRRPSPRQY